MKRLAATIVLAAALASLLTAPAQTAIPKPSPVASSWQLDIETRTPHAISVLLPGAKERQTFWYMVYTVANHTGSDQTFVPEFTLYTDTGQVLRAGSQVPADVFDFVKRAVNDPHLLDSIAVGGRLLQGDDNAKTGVAIWPDFDPKAGGFDVFIGGLSGESVEISLPSPVEVVQRTLTGTTQQVTKDKMVLFKTLELQFSVPGEAAARPRAVVSLEKKDWVMR
ncbi:MAG: hypothetical protein ACE15C_19310 [Phycisphaerae bacterium]